MARFSVGYTFHGRTTETVEAESLESAKAAIEAKLDDDDFMIDADEIDDVEFHVQQMHPITRDGREIWTTYVKSGDVRGHQSAIDNAPLFSGIPEPKEAALKGAVA